MLVCLIQSSLIGFSPYENFILSGQDRQVGLIATVEIDDIDSLKGMLGTLPEEERLALGKAGIKDLSIFVREINGRGLVFAYFLYSHKDYKSAASLLLKNSPTVSRLSSLLIPHPRANPGSAWMHMEWMNCIGTTAVFPHQSKSVRKMALVSGLKPEKELDYRLLHQTNWPGNTECMVECNYRNWTTYLIEFGDELLLFSYTEYIGEDLDEDNRKMAANPVTQRWWKHSNASLINLVGEGDWTLMNPVYEGNTCD